MKLSLLLMMPLAMCGATPDGLPTYRVTDHYVIVVNSATLGVDASLADKSAGVTMKFNFGNKK